MFCGTSNRAVSVHYFECSVFHSSMHCSRYQVYCLPCIISADYVYIDVGCTYIIYLIFTLQHSHFSGTGVGTVSCRQCAKCSTAVTVCFAKRQRVKYLPHHIPQQSSYAVRLLQRYRRNSCTTVQDRISHTANAVLLIQQQYTRFCSTSST